MLRACGQQGHKVLPPLIQGGYEGCPWAPEWPGPAHGFGILDTTGFSAASIAAMVLAGNFADAMPPDM